MAEARGGASASPRPRDRRGRFVSTKPTVTVIGPSKEEQIVSEFMRRGIVQFPDPFYRGSKYTMQKGQSMKGYPVKIFHSHHKGRAFHPCPGGFTTYIYDPAQRRGKLPYGYQLAISPNGFYGWPGDKWEGEWTIEGMATLLVHLVHSQNMREVSCGDEVGRRAPRVAQRPARR